MADGYDTPWHVWNYGLSVAAYYGIGGRLSSGAVFGYLKRVVFEFNEVFYLCLNATEITVRGWNKTNKRQKTKQNKQKKHLNKINRRKGSRKVILLIATHRFSCNPLGQNKDNTRF